MRLQPDRREGVAGGEVMGTDRGAIGRGHLGPTGGNAPPSIWVGASPYIRCGPKKSTRQN
jgi:hypothetical protein